MEVKISELLRNALKGYKAKPKTDAPKPVDRRQPIAVAIFKSRFTYETWLFMAHIRKPIELWRQAFYDLHQKPAPAVDPPDGVTLDFGELNDSQRAEYYCDDPGKCMVCHGTGIAYIIRGPLLLNDIPQRLYARTCWCRARTKEKKGFKLFSI